MQSEPQHLKELSQHIENFIKANPDKFKGENPDVSQVPGVKAVPKPMIFRCAHCQKPVLSGSDRCTYCNKPTDQTFKAGDLINGRYLVEDLLVKRGGFGNLYAVVDTQDQQRLIIKQLQHKRQIREKDRELFLREAEILQRLHHPNIPRFHDSFELDGALYIALERIDGLNLSTLVRDRGKLPEREVLEMLTPILDVFEYLGSHTPPIIHRDVKPNNFMRSMDGRVYLLDFGNATFWRTRKVDEPVEMGPPRELTAVWTKGYAAPEALMGMITYPATDLYSLACTLLFMLTNNHPLGLYEARTGTYHFPENTVSEPLKPILSRMLSLKVEDRYRNAAEVRQALRDAGLIN